MARGTVFENQLMPRGFYPYDADALRALVRGNLALAAPVTGGTVHAIIAPHAGYTYCAPQLAAAFKVVAGRQYRRVVTVAFTHRVALTGFSVLDADGYKTPLGVSPVDRAVTARLNALPGGGYQRELHDTENSTAVMVPWIQETLGLTTPVVEIALGQPTDTQADGLAAALAALAGDSTLLVFSTDMSHYHEGAVAEKMDGDVIALLESARYAELAAQLATRQLECCGSGPLGIAFRLASQLRWPAPHILMYGHSGQITGDYAEVVGYMAGVWATGAVVPPRAEPMPAAAQQALLRLARQTVETFVRTGDTLRPPGELAVLTQKLGAFVTLKKHGQLRGCIGNIIGQESLPQTIINMAVAAVAHDPRFRPVGERELGDIAIEISVLIPSSRCRNPQEIVVGRDGIILRVGRSSGVFLPQVPVEQGWDRAEYLREIGLKAGLDTAAWQDPRAE
ncbi:MAG TPA: AmmeMemoRadiSam system protein B, partial [bacterium]|nr:AmmeMemoRadiSam system protein B [bacterium]